MLTKILAVLAALVVAGLVSLAGVQTHRAGKATDRAVAAETQAGEYQRSLGTLKAVREAEKKDAARATATLQNRAVVAEKAAKAAKKESEALREALQVNRDWADSPIPPGVLDAIKGTH